MADVLSHGRYSEDALDEAIAAARERIATIPPELGTQEQLLADLAEWSECDFGRWMLCNGGWNGYWTSYVITYPDRIAAGEPDVTNSVEKFFLSQSPGIVATQERFKIFQQTFRELISADSVVLEIPCGTMEDLLSMPDLPTGATLIGADIDEATLPLAQQRAEQQGRSGQLMLVAADAWSLPAGKVVNGDQQRYQELIAAGCDVVTSNGLNIYVEDDAQVVELYRSLASSLRPGGHAVISALTPREDWQVSDVSRDVLRRAHALNLMNGVGWLNMRSRELTTQQLGEAGLEVVEVRNDARKVFPTYVARRVS